MQDIKQLCLPIRALLLDIDGVLTPGHLIYGSDGLQLKAFHIHDGLGIKLLQRAGIKVGIISAKDSDAARTRIKELGIQHVMLGHEEKLPAYSQLKKDLQLTDAEIAYIGDDLPDLPILKRVGFAATVPNAPDIIHEHVHYVTRRAGGEGAVRECAELLLNAQNKLLPMLQSYLI